MRRKIMGITIPPWYHALPIFGISAATLSIVAIIGAEIYFHVSPNRIFESSFGLIYLFTLISVFILVPFWIFWVAPWFASDDPDYLPAKSPRQVARDLTLSMWTMSLIVWCATVLFMTAICVIGVMDPQRRPIRIDLILTWAVVGTSLGAIPLLWVIPISRRVRQRVRDTARRRCVCFACGYDLRGNPEGACPECGHRDAGM